MKQNITKKRVYYADTDSGGIVYYAKYLEWFEIGRTELLRESDIEWAKLEKQGFLAPVIKVECEYKKPVENNEIISIVTKIEKIGNSSIKFIYEILNSKKETAATGLTINVFVKNGKSVRIPDNVRKKLE